MLSPCSRLRSAIQPGRSGKGYARGETTTRAWQLRHKPDDSTRLIPHLAVVDDENSIRELIGDLLAENGYDVDLAADRAQALRLCEQAHDDLILSDLPMPNMDGLVLYQQLRMRFRPTMPSMVFVTAEAHSFD